MNPNQQIIPIATDHGGYAMKSFLIAKLREAGYEVKDFGTFSENSPVVSCTFTFSNVGNAPLVIHQAVASCGCTVPDYTKEPILPGQKGTIKVTYNGTGKYPGHFKKSITLRTNAKTEMLRLYIEGDMTAKDAK